MDPTLASQRVIAYGPEWAIGTSRAATPEGANAALCEALRPSLAGLFVTAVASAIRIQYGGAVTAGNAGAFFSRPEIDGAQVGGASLKAGGVGEDCGRCQRATSAGRPPGKM